MPGVSLGPGALGTLSAWFAAVFSPRALYNVYNEKC